MSFRDGGQSIAVSRARSVDRVGKLTIGYGRQSVAASKIKVRLIEERLLSSMRAGALSLSDGGQSIVVGRVEVCPYGRGKDRYRRLLSF